MMPPPGSAGALAGKYASEDSQEILVLPRLTSLVQRELPLDELLAQVLRALADATSAERVELYMLDEAGGELTGRQAVAREGGSVVPAQATATRIPLHGTDAVSSAVAQGWPEVIEDVTSPEGARRVPEMLRGHAVTFCLAVLPLCASGKVAGVLVLSDPRRRACMSDRLPLLAALASHAGFAIERTILEEKLRRSERRYRQFIERSPDGIVESRPDGRILSANDRILRMFGYTREELLSMNAADLYQLPAKREELLRALRENGHVEGMEIAVRRKDGSVAYVNVSCRLAYESGEPVMESFVRDVTESYEVERRMRTLSLAVSCSADAILSIDSEGAVTSWNQGAEGIFGYVPEEIIGRPYLTLVPPDLKEEACGVRARVDKEGYLTGYQTERMHRDGRRIPVSLTVSRIRHNGGPSLGYSVVVRDITERRKEERHRRLLSSITEQSPDAILSLDGDGRITSWNHGAQKMFGYGDEEIVGSPWVLLAPPDREAEYHAVVTSASGGPAQAPSVVDTQARTREGRLVPVRLFASVLCGPAGEPMGWSVILRDLTEQKALTEISERLHEELYSRNRLEGIIGNSPAMDEVRDRVRRVARFNSSVLLLGQSGTGKEIVANAIHYNSPRREKPFVKVNCAAIPENLLESELFGIERNVATGVDGRIGRFELADGGTLFLDEIGDMSLATQAKILRVLQEREFERVGGKKVIKVDVRIVAATNKDLEAEIQARRFRDDLYYRLNVIVIALPPLARRREDIDPLIDHFLERFASDNSLARKRLSLPARLLLNEYDWPGNVRELEHCIERAVVMSEGPEIAEADLPPSILIWKQLDGAHAASSERAKGGLAQILREVERRAVVEALERSDWVQARAARMLGISERSMWYRVKKLGLQNPPSH